MPSLKSHIKDLILGESLILEYESQLEHDFLLLLDHDPNCIDLQTQPIELTYVTTSGRTVKFYPDCWAIFKDNREFLFDISTESNMQIKIENENWALRTKAIQDFCKKMRWTYQIITEQKIHCVRLHNIKDLIMAAKHYSPLNIGKDIGKFNTTLNQYLENSPKKFIDLIHLMSVTLPHLELEEIISLLKFKIYYLDVFIEWDIPLEETIISLDEIFPMPVYDLPYNTKDTEDYIPVIIPEKDEKTIKLSDKDQLRYEERLKIVTPLINKFGNEGKYSDILEFCRNNNLPFTRAYKLYLKWKKNNKLEGLMPNRASKHSKSHLDPRVDQLLQETINNWNTGAWRDFKSAYTDYCHKCYKSELKPASYPIFRKRTRNLPAVEIKGKFRPSKQSNIKRGLSSTYQEGRYPGCIIQMDHTRLDVWLVDSFSKQPFGRPWITIGIDPFSRSIWSLYVSYDSPSQETVTQTVINGLIPKDQLKEWRILHKQLLEKGISPEQYKLPCSGFPARIQVDNSREFRANSVKDLLINLNITLEFRPIKTPEYGGFIESVWDTINSEIRGKLLEGRVHPLPKTQTPVTRVQFKTPPEYNPKNDAAITIDQFRQWLFEFVAITYSTSPKAHQNLSPNEKWVHGIKGNNAPLGGALRTLAPSEYKKINFESKISHSSTLSEKGLRFKKILYTSKWLNEARKKKILRDKQEYEFKISKWDIRTIQMLNPETNEIEILEAYKYDGDDAITRHLLKGLGKIPGFRPFRISLNDIKEAKNNIGVSQYDGKKEIMLMETLNEDLRKKVKITKKEQKHLEKLTETEDGRLKLTQAEIIAQLDNKQVPEEVKQIDKLIVSKKENIFTNLDELEEFPTEWEEAKKKMRISFIDTREE